MQKTRAVGALLEEGKVKAEGDQGHMQAAVEPRKGRQGVKGSKGKKIKEQESREEDFVVDWIVDTKVGQRG